MNFLVRYKKQRLDHLDAGKGEWTQDKNYFIYASVECYDNDWNPTGWNPSTNKPEVMVIGRMQMFPKQWGAFRSFLEIGSEAYDNGYHVIRWVEEEDEWIP